MLHAIQSRVVCFFVCIFLFGMTALTSRADTVVQLNLNAWLTGTNGPINSIQVQLYDTDAPITVANFLQYITNHDYDNSVIHRSVADFIIQGGGFTPEVDENNDVTAMNTIVNYGTILNEFSPTRSNVRGTIAMAKLGGDPDSASNQWFFNVADNSGTPPNGLDYQNGGFTVFGYVIGEGMTLVDAINALPTHNFGGAFSDTPIYSEDGDIVQATNFVTFTSVVRVYPWKGGSGAGAADWGLAANWDPNSGIPDGVGAVATFGAQGATHALVDLGSAARTLGSMEFTAGTSTTISSASAHDLTFDNSGMQSIISVEGTHLIDVSVVPNNDLVFEGSGSLTFAKGISSDYNVSVEGGAIATKSIVANTLTIGAGAKVRLGSSQGLLSSGSLTPIPEPAS
ncbi:MAG: peptidylprolyl isomerase [Thermoguttaceae bacterium]